MYLFIFEVIHLLCSFDPSAAIFWICSLWIFSLWLNFLYLQTYFSKPSGSVHLTFEVLLIFMFSSIFPSSSTSSEYCTLLFLDISSFFVTFTLLFTREVKSEINFRVLSSHHVLTVTYQKPRLWVWRLTVWSSFIQSKYFDLFTASLHKPSSAERFIN